MKKIWSCILVMTSILCFHATAFMAWSPNYDGEPDMLKPGHIIGAFVWRDNDGLHLRTTASGEEHTFTGTIHTNGYFKDINDRFFRGNDYYHLRDRDTVEFQFTTHDRTVGIDFNAFDGDYTAFEIYMDGQKISPMNIYVGQNGWHPGDYKFTLDHPPYYPDEQRPVVIVDSGWYGGHWGGYWRHHW
jgi:hypothetical protein